MRLMALCRAGFGLAAVVVLTACAQVGGDSGASTPAPSASGVRGHVVAGPTCPVESTTSPCPPRPVQADVEVVELGAPSRGTSGGGGSWVIATAHSDADGRFSIGLAPGRYAVRAVPPPGPMQAARPVDVEVLAGAFTEVTLTIDTGIR
jgi:hypothetical protein